MFRDIFYLILIVSAVFISGHCLSYEPVLDAGVKIQAGGLDLDVGTYAIPVVYDWNSDGKKDLIIGQRGSGKVRVYTNLGTDAEPVFSSDENYVQYYDPVAEDYVDISVDGSGCQGAAPEVVDWNNDGMKDLLVGDGLGKTVLFINQNEVSDETPDLLEEGFIQVGGVDYTVDYRAVPCVYDWNADGKKDLLIGRGDGEISVLINVNIDDDPVFDNDDRVYADFQILDTWGRTAPRVFDWNGDGYDDVIVGEYYGNILYYQNIRVPSDPGTEPILADGVFLRTGGVQIDIGSRSRTFVVDWKNDGLPDILCGSSDGCVYYYEQDFIFEFEGISYDPSTGTTLVWRSREGDTYTVYYSTDMVVWNVLESSVESDGYTTTYTDIGSIGESNRNYKIGLAE